MWYKSVSYKEKRKIEGNILTGECRVRQVRVRNVYISVIFRVKLCEQNGV